MSRYFNYFPKTYYSLNNGVTKELVTDVFRRVKIEKNIKDNSVVYYDYYVTDSEKPEQLAHRFYGDEEKHWVILYANNIVDVNQQWPLAYRELNEFIENKYGSLSTAKSGIHSYLKITQYIMSGSEQTRTETKIIDLTTYNSLSTGTSTQTLPGGKSYSVTVSKKARTYYEYEDEINEGKKNIKLIKPEYVQQITNEFKRKING